MPASDPSASSEPETVPSVSTDRKVMVVGCFDLLHPSHLVFLNKAASFGQLYVSLGSDQSIVSQKSRSPTFSEQERRFMLENLRCVYWVGVVSDPGPTGFREHVEAIRPDIFIINEDGHSAEKQQLVESFGAEYRVFPRDVFDSANPTSTTQIGQQDLVPTRVSLCSGFVDNPGVNAFADEGGAPLVVIPIEPFEGLQERSGMATSTRATVRKYFGAVLPQKYSEDQLGEMVFRLENPPHKRGYISGTLDSHGILGHGVRLFTYAAGQFFPQRRDTIADEVTLDWLEQHLYLKQSWPRPDGCEVTINPGHPQFAHHCRSLYSASQSCWHAIQQRDLDGLCAAINASRAAQTQIVSGHCPPELQAFIDNEDAPAAMVMGAGGGGYVLFVAETIPDDGIRISIRRGAL